MEKNTNSCFWFLIIASICFNVAAIKITLSTTENYLEIYENASPNTSLLNITVSGERVILNCQDEPTKTLVRLEPDGNRYEVLLVGHLNRENKDEHDLKFRATDSYGSTKDQTIRLYVLDVNDNHPSFQDIPYFLKLPENPGYSQIRCETNCTVFKVIATDPDEGRNGTVSYSMQPDTQSEERRMEYNETFSINPTTGVVSLLESVDYEKNNYYKFIVYAKDHGTPPLTSNTNLIIQIQDVQDRPPFFTGIPYRTTINENIQVGSSIITVNAQDGDPGVSNKVNYTIQENGNCSTYFKVNASTGEIRTSCAIDRDSGAIKAVSGVCSLSLMAEEIEHDEPQEGNTTSSTDVTIIINDLDDNKPLFDNQTYFATVQENAPKGIPITIKSGRITANDNDTGINSQYKLEIQYENETNPCKDFQPWPSDAEGQQTIMIRVTNSSILDYEERQQFTLLLIATEKRNESLTTTSTVVLDIEDVNDNNPVFPNNSYHLKVHENCHNFTNIINITATDRDSNKKLTYTLSGAGGNFYVDNSTGQIWTLCSDCNSRFDREKRSVYYLTYVVTDPGGRSDSALLEIQLLDENDNAPIFDRNYSASVKENDHKYTNASIVRVKASDDDQMETNNSQVAYSILSISSQANLTSNFSINGSTGELFLTEPLDFEKLNDSQITITVIATDKGIPQQTGSAGVVIDVQDVNDNTPEFIGNQFTGNISEDQTSSAAYHAVVGRINATDKDGTEPNNQFNFYIASGSDEKFSINSSTGVVFVQLSATLDRETKSNYTLTVMIIDRGASPKSATANMEVYIDDVNDERPTFTDSSFEADVLEGTSQGVEIVKCSAVDKDLDSLLQYSITELVALDEDGKSVEADKVKDYFEINETSGWIYVNGSIDRETAKTVTLSVMVIDENASNRTSPQNDTASVRLTVLDINDNVPEFVNNDVTLNVSENSQTPSILTTIKASDRDENRTISYAITEVYKENTKKNTFEIDEKTGVLRKTGEIDREVDDEIIITINATDNGVPSQSTSMNVTIDVIDFNDNAPIFSDSSFNHSYSIRENTSTNSIIFNVSATDLDRGPNANVTFSIDSGSRGNFTVDTLDGCVRVKNSLDRETIDHYIFLITARDNPLKPSQQKSTSTTVTVNVIDVNDNQPIFEKQAYNVAKPEDYPVNDTILKVFAKDGDEIHTNNSKVSYIIESMNCSESLFRINPDTGDIIVNMSLKDKVDIYELNITAYDWGQPRLNGSSTVVIRVEDVNLHAPVITHLPSNNTIKIFECTRVGSVIYQFNYTDRDRGKNAEVHFNLSTVGSHAALLISNTFNISEDGKLMTRLLFDVSKHTNYTFQVQATDHGDPAQKSETKTIVVQVIDVNNHLPYFDTTKVTYDVTENENNSHIGVVNAIDKDADAIKCYELKDMDAFHVEEKTGILSTTQMLDYEKSYSHDFTVSVHDCSIQQNTSDACDNVTQSGYVNNTLHVFINVKDVNDNAPVFKNKEMFTGMTRRTEINTPIKIDLKTNNYIDDKDSPANAIDVWQFFNDGPVIASSGLGIHAQSGQEKCEDGLKHVFCVHRNGSITNNKYFKEDVSGYYVVPVKVNDTAGSDVANVTVYLIGDSQILVMTILDTKENVADNKDALLKAFGDVIGYNLVYDKLEDHKTLSGEIASSQSDLHFHVVDRTTNEVLSGSAARRLLDSAASRLSSIMKQFSVISVEKSVQSKQEEDKSSKTTFILVAVIVTLVVSNAIFIYVFLHVRRRYRRKLKAAVTTHDKGMEMQTSSLAVPGSNKYISQSNPLLNVDIDEQQQAKYDAISLKSNNSLDSNEIHYHDVATSECDKIEEKGMTLDMYTEDTLASSIEDESPLEAALRLHEKSKESAEGTVTESGEEEDVAAMFVNPALDDELECTDI